MSGGATMAEEVGAAAAAGGRPKVLVAEKLAPAGVAALEQRCDVTCVDGLTHEELVAKLSDVEALVVRSATKVTAELIDAAPKLRVVGRAGVGVDNVDLDAASRRGVVVVNAPTSNVLSVAEHCMGLMLAVARNIARGDATLKAGEWQRSSLSGVELAGRTLVLLGMGRIGQLVAERARAFDMRVVGYDPFLPRELFQRVGVEYAETLDDALAMGDVVSLHMPLTTETRGMIGEHALSAMRDGVVIVNTARGALVDLDALDAACEAGRVGGVALDVFPVEPPPAHPLFARTNVLVTPHLAASTREAQDRAGEQVAEQVVAALLGGSVTSAVNVPAIGADDVEALQPWVPVSMRLARLAQQLALGAPRRLSVTARGEIAAFDVRMLTTGALVGVLSGTCDEPVNVVNAPHMAQQRGLDVQSATDDAARTYRSLAVVEVETERGCVEVDGTTFGQRDRPWLTRVLGFAIDIELAQHMAFFRYGDVPGVIGKVGSAFGAAGVNIANMAVGRANGEALMAVSFDERPPADVMDEIGAGGPFAMARLVDLG